MKLTVGQLLRKCRIKANMSVEDVSVFLAEQGIKSAPKTIYGWEAGNNYPSLHTFFTLCTYYGVTDILGTLGYTDSKEQ